MRGARHAALLLAIALLADLYLAAHAAAAAAPSPYPGGRWAPGPAAFSVSLHHDWLVMEDGVRLRATIGYPADPETNQRAPGTFPVILQHSPYTDEPVGYFVEHGYIFVNVRPRGTGDSGGAVDFNGLNDRRDGVRIIDWVARELAGSNGMVGLYGCSYPGQLALANAAAVGPDSPVKAVAALCAAGDYSHEIELVGGVATPGVAVLPNIAQAVGGSAATVAYFTALRDEILRGGDAAYHRRYWRDRLLTGDSAASVVANDIPVLLWAGWADVVEKAELEMYANFQNAYAGHPVSGPMPPNAQASARYQIILGDWGHGEGLDNGIVLQWFDTWLRKIDTGIRHTPTPMHLFEQGSKRWINAHRYPMVKSYTTFHLSPDRSLSTAPPGAPVDHSITWAQPDTGALLPYTTAPLTQGATLAGPISASVRARSSNTNMEMIAFLYDVAPDGTQTEISNGVVLGSQRALDAAKTWHDAHDKLIYPYTEQANDDYLTPGASYQLDIGLFPRVWSIQPGHALRLTLATQMPRAFCDAAYFGSEPCYLTTPQTRSLPGGVYHVQSGLLNLPLLPHGCFATATSGATPTSEGVSMPLDWGDGYPGTPVDGPPPACEPPAVGMGERVVQP